MRDREHPGRVLNQPAAMGLVTLYDGDDARTQVTEQARRPTTAWSPGWRGESANDAYHPGPRRAIDSAYCTPLLTMPLPAVACGQPVRHSTGAGGSESCKPLTTAPRLFVVGGAAMALAYDESRVTRDLDALFVPAPEVRQIAEAISVCPFNGRGAGAVPVLEYRHVCVHVPEHGGTRPVTDLGVVQHDDLVAVVVANVRDLGIAARGHPLHGQPFRQIGENLLDVLQR